jgi:hypothetical protein
VVPLEELRFSGHALRQMARRRISRLEVAEALANPETTYPSAERPERTVVLGRAASGRRLKVVVTGARQTVVVTAADRDQVP